MLAFATHSTVQSWERTLITITIIVVVIVIALLGINARASCKLGQHIDTELWFQPQTVNPSNFFICSIQMSLSLRTADFYVFFILHFVCLTPSAFFYPLCPPPPSSCLFWESLCLSRIERGEPSGGKEGIRVPSLGEGRHFQGT